MSFSNWFFAQLPKYFKENDTYKNPSGEGLLERYLRVFGEELDQETIPKIDDFSKQFDPLLADSQLLNHIAYTLGNPPDFFVNEAQYRRFLTFIMSLYKVKGTLKAYQALFGFFGITIQLLVEYSQCTYYDEYISLGGRQVEYDSGYHYDSCCEMCIPYELVYSAQLEPCLTGTPSQPFTPVFADQALLDLFEKLVCLIEPIKMELTEMTPGIFICETYGLNPQETVVGELIDPDTYDENPILLYDDGFLYDNYTTTIITIL